MILNKTITFDDTKAFLLNHKCHLARRKTIKKFHLPTANMNQVMVTSNENTKMTFVDTTQQLN